MGIATVFDFCLKGFELPTIRPLSFLKINNKTHSFINESTQGIFKKNYYEQQKWKWKTTAVGVVGVLSASGAIIFSISKGFFSANTLLCIVATVATASLWVHRVNAKEDLFKLTIDAMKAGQEKEAIDYIQKGVTTKRAFYSKEWGFVGSNSLLAYASKTGCKQVIDHLLSLGMDINVTESVRHVKDLETLKYLVQKGADIKTTAASDRLYQAIQTIYKQAKQKDSLDEEKLNLIDTECEFIKYLIDNQVPLSLKLKSDIIVKIRIIFNKVTKFEHRNKESVVTKIQAINHKLI